MKDYQDAFGHQVYDRYQGREAFDIIERDDGYIDVADSSAYFSDYKAWSPRQKRAMRYVKGRVLDIGCGAGRHSIHLQEKGFDVLGIDVSPLAIEVCRKRGLRNAKVMPVTKIQKEDGPFDTILMFGNNFGLFGNLKRAGWLLKKFHNLTTQTGRIIAESNDPYQTVKPFHLEYHQLNREKGRMAGQIRIRVRYAKYITPWFDYLFLSKAEMEEILLGTGWKVRRFIDSEGAAYIAVLEKEPR